MLISHLAGNNKMLVGSIKKCIEVSIFFIVILGVWVLFAVPVIFYHLQQEVSDIILIVLLHY